MPNHQDPRTREEFEDYKGYQLLQALPQEVARISFAPSPTPTPLPRKHIHDWGHYNLHQNLCILHNEILCLSITPVKDYEQLHTTWLKLVCNAAALLPLRCDTCDEPIRYPEATAKAKDLVEKFEREYQPDGSLPGRENLKRLGNALRELIRDFEVFR